MTKRLTKKQREEKAKAALEQRIQDTVNGATGGYFDSGEDWLTAENLSRVVPALRDTFQGEKDEHGRCPWSYCFDLHNLNHYDDVSSITNFLFEQGIRA